MQLEAKLKLEVSSRGQLSVVMKKRKAVAPPPPPPHHGSNTDTDHAAVIPWVVELVCEVVCTSCSLRRPQLAQPRCRPASESQGDEGSLSAA